MQVLLTWVFWCLMATAISVCVGLVVATIVACAGWAEAGRNEAAYARRRAYVHAARSAVGVGACVGALVIGSQVDYQIGYDALMCAIGSAAMIGGFVRFGPQMPPGEADEYVASLAGKQARKIVHSEIQKILGRVGGYRTRGDVDSPYRESETLADLEEFLKQRLVEADRGVQR